MRVFNFLRDVIDANTESDQRKRLAKGEARLYADQQRARGNKRPADNIGQQFLGNTLRFLNTAKAGVEDVVGVGQIAKESVFGTDQSYEDTVDRVYRRSKTNLDPEGGIARAGTIFDSPEQAQDIDAKTLAKKTVGSAVGAYGEVGPGVPLKGLGKFAPKLMNAKTVEEVAKILEGKVAPEVIERIAPKLAKETGKKSIAKILSEAESLGSKVIRGLTRGAIEGGAGAAGSQLALEGKIDPANVASSAAFGAALGGAAPVAGKAIDTGKKTVKQIHRSEAGSLGPAESPNLPLPLSAPETPTRAPRSTPALDELRSNLKTTTQARAEQQDVTPEPLPTNLGNKIYQHVFDKYDPLARAQKRVEDRGGAATPETRAADLAYLHSGQGRANEEYVRGLTDIVADLHKNYGVDDGDFAAYLAARRISTDRASIGNTVGADKALAAIDEIAEKYGDETAQRVAEAGDYFIEHNSRLLEELHSSGHIGDEAFRAIQEANENYTSPFQVAEFIVDDLEKGGEHFGSGASFNSAKNALIKAQKGMKEGTTLINPIEATINNTHRVLTEVSRNNVVRAVGSWSKEAPELVIKLRTAEDVTARSGLYSEASEMRSVRNELFKALKKRGQAARSLEREITATEGEFARKAAKSDVKELSKAGAKDEASALRDLKGKDLKEIYSILIDYPDKQFERIRQKLVRRNKALAGVFDDIAALRPQYAEAKARVGDLTDAAKGLADKPVPDGYEKVSAWKNGIREDYAVPREIADVLKGLTSEQADMVSQFVSRTSRVMKAANTTLSVPFILIKNPIRDLKTSATNSRNIDNLAGYPARWIGGIVSYFKKDAAWREFIASGGGGAGQYERGLTPGEQALRRATEAKGEKLGRLIKHPVQLIEFLTEPFRYLGEGIENAPRLAEFKAGLEKGKSGAESALDARNVTTDFARSGKVGQIANMWVPFLNARLQGTNRLMRSFRENPARAGGIYAALTAAPLITSYVYNQTQHAETFSQIPQDTKDNYFVIVTSDEKDAEGNPTGYVKIPKAEIDQILGNPLENFLSYLYKNDPKGFDQMAMETLSNLSPQSFVKDGELSGSRALSGLPPIIKTPVEAVTNRNLYFDRDIVPQSLADLPDSEQVTENTAFIPRQIAKLTRQSPMQTENALRGLTGNLLVTDPLTGIRESLTGGGGNQAKNTFYNRLNKVKPLKASADKRINEAIAAGDYAKAQAIAQAHNEAVKKAFKGWAARYGHLATDDLTEAYNDQKIRLTRNSIAQRRYNLRRKAKQEGRA